MQAQHQAGIKDASSQQECSQSRAAGEHLPPPSTPRRRSPALRRLLGLVHYLVSNPVQRRRLSLLCLLCRLLLLLGGRREGVC